MTVSISEPFAVISSLSIGCHNDNRVITDAVDRYHCRLVSVVWLGLCQHGTTGVSCAHRLLIDIALNSRRAGSVYNLLNRWVNDCVLSVVGDMRGRSGQCRSVIVREACHCHESAAAAMSTGNCRDTCKCYDVITVRQDRRWINERTIRVTSFNTRHH